MLFNSYIFIFAFLPAMCLGYFLFLRFSKSIYAKSYLIGGSFVFYGYWNPLYVPILLGSILINFFISSKITRGGGYKNTSKLWLIAGIAFNLFLLGFFKYTDFLLTNFNIAFDTNFELPYLALPLAISFFTFQQIAYLCDCYTHKNKSNLLDYCLFVVFFPQLIAGPIVNHREMLPQFKFIKSRWFDSKNFTKGLFIFSIGLFKKTVIADSFALYANNGFSASLEGIKLSFFESWFTSLSYTFQLYFDFSGYCDMAIGIALFFNIFLPINFNSPYKAINIQDFWKRWHITLGKFFTQYLYIPLGGSKFGKIKTLRNLAIVFILSGIWHGAGWGFIIWGCLHAMAIVIHRIYGYIFEFFDIVKPQNIFYKTFCWVLTFNFINASWVFFRAETLESALSILRGMIGGNGIVFPSALTYHSIKIWISSFVVLSNFVETTIFAITLCVAIFILLQKQNSSKILHIQPSYAQTLFYSCLFSISILQLLANNQVVFLYFNF